MMPAGHERGQHGLDQEGQIRRSHGGESCRVRPQTQSAARALIIDRNQLGFLHGSSHAEGLGEAQVAMSSEMSSNRRSGANGSSGSISESNMTDSALSQTIGSEAV